MVKLPHYYTRWLYDMMKMAIFRYYGSIDDVIIAAFETPKLIQFWILKSRLRSEPIQPGCDNNYIFGIRNIRKGEGIDVISLNLNV